MASVVVHLGSLDWLVNMYALLELLDLDAVVCVNVGETATVTMLLEIVFVDQVIEGGIAIEAAVWGDMAQTADILVNVIMGAHVIQSMAAVAVRRAGLVLCVINNAQMGLMD